MKLAFSNIAWTPHNSIEILTLLKKNGVSGIEIAPTKVWENWQGATVEAARAYRQWLNDLGFEIPAMQAVLFGKPQAHLFNADGQAQLFDHLCHVAELAAAFGARVVVLGAPKQRDRGNLSFTDALEIAVPQFQQLAEVYHHHQTCLCIEPNPQQYACNFIINASEGAQLVQLVNHPGFALHLDAAGMFQAGDDLQNLWPTVGPLLRHFHISEPDLADFAHPQVPHAENFQLLQQKNYSGWCSVEMRERPSLAETIWPWKVLEQSNYWAEITA